MVISWLFTHLYACMLLCSVVVIALHAHHILPSRPMRSGERILILVRQPDPRFTPRV